MSRQQAAWRIVATVVASIMLFFIYTWGTLAYQWTYKFIHLPSQVERITEEHHTMLSEIQDLKQMQDSISRIEGHVRGLRQNSLMFEGLVEVLPADGDDSFINVNTLSPLGIYQRLGIPVTITNMDRPDNPRIESLQVLDSYQDSSTPRIFGRVSVPAARRLQIVPNTGPRRVHFSPAEER